MVYTPRGRSVFVAITVICLSVAALAQVPSSEHVILIIDENSSFSSVMANMPWLVGQGKANGYATNYQSDNGGSLLDYLWLASGSCESSANCTLPPATNNFNCNGNSCFYPGTSTSDPITDDNIFRLMNNAGISWKVYAQSYAAAGGTPTTPDNNNHTAYYRRHNGATWYGDILSDVSGSAGKIVDLSHLSTDLKDGTLPRFAIIVPDGNHDAHDCPVGMTSCTEAQQLAAADQFLDDTLNPILSTTDFQPGGSGLIIVTFDECAGGTNAGCGAAVYTALIGPRVRPQTVSSIPYKHENALRTMLDSLGIHTYPGASATAADMSDFFSSASSKPEVVINTALAAAPLNSPVSLRASAYPTLGNSIAGWRIYVDSVSKYTAGAVASINPSLNMSPGTHMIVVLAWESSGAYGIQAVPVNVMTPKPQVTISAPANNADVGTQFNLRASASASPGRAISGWRVYLDGVGVYATATPLNAISVNLSTTPGTHTVMAIAWDNSGSYGVQSVILTVGAKPVVTVSSPAAGASLVSPIAVRASAMPGVGRSIGGWWVYLDGVGVYSAGRTNSIAASIPAAVGTHNLVVRAWDDLAAYGDQSFTVNIKAAVNVTPSAGTVQPPVIRDVHAIPGITSCTVTWTTDKPSDSLLGFATGMGPWIPAWSEMDKATTDTTPPGVTRHSQTIKNLWPGGTFSIYLRSRPFSDGTPDTNPNASGDYDGDSACNNLHDGSACNCTVLKTTPTASDYDLKLWIAGSENVAQGYDTYLQLYYSDLARPTNYAASMTDITISGLPPHSTVSVHDAFGYAASFDSGTGLLKMQPSIVAIDTAVRIATTASTPIGTYTITFSNVHAEHYPSVTHSYTYKLNVVRPSFAYGTPSSYPPIPNLGDKNTKGTWVYGMVTQGARANFCNQDVGAGANFYDGIRAYQQTMAYDAANSITGNPSQWKTCIANLETAYLGYVNAQPTPGTIWAIYLASKGLMNLALAGDASARTGLYETADHAQWKSMRSTMMDVGLERELNYTTEAFIAAEGAGDTNESNLIPVGIDYLLADIDQIVNAGVSHEPFLDGTLADTLIHYYIDTGSKDTRIPPAIKELADHLWNNYWIVGDCSNTGSEVITGCFAYSAGTSHMGFSIDDVASDGADLNLLVAPMYAWLFKMTGNGTIPGSDGSQCGGKPGQPCTYQQAGDIIFQKGVSESDYFLPKMWAQDYRWSFDYVTWRSKP